MRALAIDLFCGVGGWTDGLLACGYDVVGFDIERHRYPARDMGDSSRKVMREGVDFNSSSRDSRDRSFNYANQCAVRDAPLTGGWHEYPAQLVLQDVRTLHGSQFRNAALIVASPPCQEFSWMAMPWSRAKAVARALRGQGEFPEGYRGSRTISELTALFDACFRIQREAIAAAGHHIPLVVENVRGAIPWVGRSRWNFGSYHLWGDVPALMPMTVKRSNGKSAIVSVRHKGCTNFHQSEATGATKNDGGSWFNVAHNTTSGKGQNPDGRKTVGHVNQRDGYSHTRHLTNQDESDAIKNGGDWFDSEQPSLQRRHGSKSSARKAASAMIARIPFPLAQHIGAYWKPREEAA